jgi:hypothetical protein
MAPLEQFYVLATDDLDLINARRGVENRLGLAIEHLGLRPFLRADFRAALELAAQAAFGTDDGTVIMRDLLAGCLKPSWYILVGSFAGGGEMTL